MNWPKDFINKVVVGDSLKSLRKMPDGCIQTCVTSPPYWGLRDYGVKGQMGLEKTPEAFVSGMVELFEEVRRVLRDDGTLWLNIGDSYAGSWGAQGRQGKTGALAGRSACAERQITAAAKKKSGTGSTRNMKGIKPKDLVGIPWMLAFALRSAGWYLRQDNIWHKPNPMPESVKDRCTKAHEYVFHLSKSEKYYFDQEAISEPVSGTAHARGDGVNPKAAKTPSGWATGAGAHETLKHVSRSKQNASFSGAVSGLVSRRNKRSVWSVQSQAFSEAHFATFPEKLIEPCILAGTSEKGACAKCGAPISRVIKREGGRDWRNDKIKPKGIPGELSGEGSYKRGQSSSPLNDTKTVTTTGWAPGCKCGQETVPCVVLDPFGGAGTTGLVAAKHQRDFILLELNPEYAEMARKRIQPELDQGKLL